VAALTLRIVTADGRGVITAPRYDAAFSDANAGVNPPANGWIDQLRSDPRLRGAAGLGVYNTIEWQDRIADAAAAKAGDLAIARDRINHVAFGVELSRSLWRRRLPADPVDRLAVLAPALPRLVTTTSDSVLDTIAGRTPGLTRAFFSSAARRALRPGPARTALTADGVAPFGQVLIAANKCTDRPDAAIIRGNGGDPAGAIKKAIIDAAGGDNALAGTILGALGNNPSAGKVAAALRALAPDKKGKPNRDAIDRFLHTREFPDTDRSLLEWPGFIKEHARPEPCKPVDLGRLSAFVTAAIDPTVARPPAVGRVLSTLPGITHIGPVEIEPELDLPLWSFLSSKAPDWMLPGAGDLIDGDVVGLKARFHADHGQHRLVARRGVHRAPGVDAGDVGELVVGEHARRRDAQVIAGNAVLLRQRRIADRRPFLDIGVPEIGQGEGPVPGLRRQQRGARHQRRDRHGELQHRQRAA
jgi:hypothetical protein